jgi:hypothetical protein
VRDQVIVLEVVYHPLHLPGLCCFLVNKRADNFEEKSQGFYTLLAKLAKERVTLLSDIEDIHG